ncbi:hypothetical protein M1563_00825 [Patescibacteria group bacterium]|nr:hypothetical protein [Patescibacteria group bacterium]MCL5410159.1 hypothetical protein [Patescibacteria group bacterium]
MSAERPNGEQIPSRPRLYDPIPKDLSITPQLLREQYDGTVFNGEVALRVEFDEQGEVLEIKCFNLFDNEYSVPFTPGRTGGWRGEGGFYGESTVLGTRLNAVVTATQVEWRQWQETAEQHPGIDFRTWKAVNSHK